MADDVYDFGYGLPGDVSVDTYVPGLAHIYDFGYNLPGDVSVTGEKVGGIDLATILNSLKGVGGLFTGTTGGPLGQLAAFGGLGGLLSQLGGGGGSQPSTGYQGGIPKYTIERAQTPLSQQRPENYRPGQGGITYFTPIKYAEQKPVTATANPSTQTGSAVKTEEQNAVSAAHGGYMPGGIAMLAGGGNTSRYLRGPGDGVSDSIPAKFDHSGQPARLADGEFVIDARTVSEIGNGSSEAGARKLYAMMDRVHKARKKAVRGKPSGADKFLPK